jgi:hypothetical protein
MGQHCHAITREFQSARRAAEQRQSQGLLQILDLQTYRRLRQIQSLCGPSEVPLCGHSHERSKEYQIHRELLVNTIMKFTRNHWRVGMVRPKLSFIQ